MVLRNKNISKHEAHPFHVVDSSPWPFLTSWTIFLLAISFLVWIGDFRCIPWYFFRYDLIWLFLFILGQWFANIVVESTYEGHHTRKVRAGLRLGMILFIASEAMFFFSFFWSYFHFALSPSIFIGETWPPVGLEVVKPCLLPLVNTCILCISGIYITCSHELFSKHKLFNRWQIEFWLTQTIFCGLLFLIIQREEYCEAVLRFNDGIYGSLFYILTGFHGLHVVIGVLFLIVCLFRQRARHFTARQHLGYEAAILYWHFVDLVWLFLFYVVYIWGVGVKVHSGISWPKTLEVFSCFLG